MPLSHSQRLGLLSTSLSAWVEGSAGLRNTALLALADAPISNTPLEQFHSDDWKGHFLHWLTRPSKELDYTENGVLATLDLMTAFTILKILRIKPLLPFLLTPILATVPLPTSFTASLSKISWRKTALTILNVTLLEELNKVTILYILKQWHRHRAHQRKLRTGKVVARGAELRLPLDINEDEDEEIECLICSGLGTEGPDPMAQSVSSISTANFETPGTNATNRQDPNMNEIDAFGPLEEFCVTAPHKHVAHRECFLRWVEAYRQQQQRIFLEPVNIQFDSRSDGEATLQRMGREERTRIRTILQMTGFEHTLPSLIFPSSTVVPDGTSPNEHLATRRGAGPQSRSSLLTIPQVSPTSSAGTSEPAILASLRTSSPPCPACRGPVSILFVREGHPVQARAGKTSLLTTEQRALKILRNLARGWWKECLLTVTGRSLLIRLASQYSFLLVLVSMIKAAGRGRMRK